MHVCNEYYYYDYLYIYIYIYIYVYIYIYIYIYIFVLEIASIEARKDLLKLIFKFFFFKLLLNSCTH